MEPKLICFLHTNAGEVVTWSKQRSFFLVQSINFITPLLLSLGLDLVLLALSTNVESGTQFAEV